MNVESPPIDAVSVLDRWALNQLVKMYYVPLIPDGDVKRLKVLFPLVADGQMYYGYCINCLYPTMGDA